MKSMSQRFSNRVIELESGFHVIRFVDANETEGTSVNISVMPDEPARIEMLGDVAGGVGHLKNPGSLIVVRAFEPTRLLATIITSIKVLRANVRIDVQRLDAAPPSGASTAAPQQSDRTSAALPTTAGTSQATTTETNLASTIPWLRWDNRPSQVMLSVSIADRTGTWSPPRLAEDIDFGAISDLFGIRCALVGPGRHGWELKAMSRLHTGRTVEALGAPVTLPPTGDHPLAEVALFVRNSGTEWQQVLWWRQDTR